MKLSISRKIVCIAAMGMVASSVSILCISTMLMGKLLTRTMYDDMSAMQSMVARIQQHEEARILQSARMLAATPQLMDAVHAADRQRVREIAQMAWQQLGLDTVVVTDANGIVLARGHSSIAGDDISRRPTMIAALKGEVRAGVLFEESAVVPFSIRCNAPIFKDGVVVGALSLGSDIGTEAYIDGLSEVTGMAFTLFKGDTRLMTSVREADGKRAIGTQLTDAQVTDTVLRKGETTLVLGELLGEPGMTVYWPAKDFKGNIIGMWAIAKLLTQHTKETNKVLMVVVLCSLGIMLLFVLAASLLGRRIALPIRKATAYAVQVATGNLDASLSVQSQDEVGVLVDALRTMVTTLKERIREADAANKAKSSFLSTMSHEIRTPMNAILGITEIQLHNETLAPDVKDSIEKIYTSGDLLLSIINDILDLSKIEAGKLDLHINKYEIASLASDTAQLNMIRIGNKPIEFELQVDAQMPSHMAGDELRIKQILNNVLSNAFKYTKAGMVKLSISAEAGKSDDEAVLVVDVSDTGQGMTDEQVSRLFDEYARFNQSANRTTEGTGLGMSITRNLIRLMNGEIVVESEPGKGTSFTIRLPQGRSGSGVLGKEMAENLHQFRTHRRATMKWVQVSREPMPYGSVLIVDDVEINIFVATGLLTPYKLKIESAGSGFAAIEKIKQGKVYDIVFMDHMMPEMDGIETTKILRGMGYVHSIVALTANAVAGQSDIFLENDFDGFLSKPIDIRELNIVLNKLVRDKQPPEIIAAARQQTEARQGETLDNKAQQPALDPACSEIFVRDAIKSLAALEAIIGKGGSYDDDDLRMYVTHVHGMKSALANVSKMDLSAMALKLEQSGRDGNIEAIASETPVFLRTLRTLVEKLAREQEKTDGKTRDALEADNVFLL